MNTQRPLMHNQGFSLIELMIAMVILAIGILATMAMQFTALAGYTSASELTKATELSHTVDDMISLQARGHSPFEGQPDLVNLVENNNGWTRIQDDPVSYGMIDGQRQRFCVYVAGSQMPGTWAESNYYQVAVAVVYPRSRQGFASNCDDDDITDSLNSDVDTQIALEQEGYRAVHLTTSMRL